MPTYFTPDYLQFFKELSRNNTKEWFDANRKRYESTVREPFKEFITELIEALSAVGSPLKIDAKDAIFRINRDIRFSKDKTPYKTFNSALIAPNGRKGLSHPGLYIELNHDHLAIFGGVYSANTQQVYNIRKCIAKHPKQFSDLISEPNFFSKYGNIKGLKHKRIPIEFKESAQTQALIFNKQWYYQAFLPSEEILSDGLLNLVLEYHNTASRVNQFLAEALMG